MKTFLSAVQFLTILPVPDPGWEAGRMDRAAAWFPLVGALVGVLAGLVATVAAGVPSRVPVVSGGLLAFVVIVVVTGGLHEDGLADVADGMGARTRERRFEIMRDSRIGTFGALALIVMVMVRVPTLDATTLLVTPSSFKLSDGLGGHTLVLSLVAGLAAACAAARAGMLALIWTLPYAREEAAPIGPPDTQRVGTAAALLGLAVAPLAALTSPLVAGAALGSAALTSLACILFFRRTLGGWTGDAAGATCVLCEVAFLTGALAARWN